MCRSISDRSSFSSIALAVLTVLALVATPVTATDPSTVADIDAPGGDFAAPGGANATPAGDTLSESNPLVTWSGGPGTPTAEATCNGPDDPACDNFKLTILPPSYDDYKVAIVVTPTGGDDYDMQVYRPDGVLFDSSGNNPGSPEFVNLFNPEAGTWTVSVANFAAATPYAASAEMTDVTSGGGGGGAGADVSFAIYTAPDGMGTNAGEPSIGSNWNSDRLMYIAGLEVLQVSLDQCTSPATTTWKDVTFPTQGVTTLDPILFTDSETGRTFASQLSAKCSNMSYTDDDGETWTPSQGCGINAGVDHQSVGGGRFHAPLVRDPEGPIYPNNAYYCSQDAAIAQCARSDTGGLTFAEANPIYNLLECGGLHGHVKVAPDGTVYVPNKNCGGENGVAVSEANGIAGSWEVRRVTGTGTGTWDSSVGIASRPGDGSNGTGVNTVYIGMVSDKLPFVAVSNDAGTNWTDLQNVGLGIGPLGGDITNTAFPAMVAGDGNRAAFFFLGTEQPGDANGEDTTSPHEWYPYVSVTYDGGVTWSTTNLSPGDPVQRGNVCAGGTLCGAGRNLLDFNDATIDREGRIVVAYADGCIGSCSKNPPNSGSELATFARQVSGLRMFAEFDTVAVPEPPRFEAQADELDSDLIHITWDAPDDHGSAILEYRIYRRFQGEPGASLLATLGSAERSYDDLLAPGDPPVFYRVTAVNAIGESTFCEEKSPDPPDPVENACILPGIGVAEDPSGDTGAAAAGDPSLDLRDVFLAEPFFGAGLEKLVITIDVEDMSVPHPSAAWRAVWSSPGDVPPMQHFVSMESCDATAGIKCSYGTFDGTIYSSAGEPEGCEFTAEGLIKITVDKALVGIMDTAHTGATLPDVTGITQVFGGALCSGLLSTTDTAGPGSYEIVSNASCDDPDPVPVARDDSATTNQDVPVVIPVTANDTSFAGPARVVAVTDPVNGSVANNGDGTVTYQPDPGFFSLPTDTFDYTIEDDNGAQDTATVTVFVNPACEATPTGSFVDDFEPDHEAGWTFETPINTLGPASPTWDVVADGSAHSPTNSFFTDATTIDAKDDRMVAPPQDLSPSSELIFWHRFGFEDTYDGGVLEVSTDGGASWDDVTAAGASFVEGGYNGVIDTGFGSEIAGRAAWTGGSAADPMSRVTLDVGALAGFEVLFRWREVSDPAALGSVPGEGWYVDDVEFTDTLEAVMSCEPGPDAVDDQSTTEKDTDVDIDVLANDSHPESVPFAIDSFDQPANGTVTPGAGDTLNYDPDSGFVGDDSFTYTICDTNDKCDTATVDVAVIEDPNGLPVANPDSATTDEDTAVIIDVLANDSDPDGDPITTDSVTQPANGTTLVLGDGRIEYTPNPGFTSPPDDTFMYTISDDKGGQATATVTVTVDPASTGSANVPDGEQTLYTTSGSVEQAIADLAPGDECTFRMWVGKRSDGQGGFGRWFVQLTTGDWYIQNVLDGNLTDQTDQWVEYSTSFTVQSFPTSPIRLRILGEWGWVSYDRIELACDGRSMVSQGSFESPATADGTWSAGSPTGWTLITGGGGVFNPDTDQMHNFF